MASIYPIHDYGQRPVPLCQHFIYIIGDSFGIVRSCTFYKELQQDNTFWQSGRKRKTSACDLVPVDRGDLPVRESPQGSIPLASNVWAWPPWEMEERAGGGHPHNSH